MRNCISREAGCEWSGHTLRNIGHWSTIESLRLVLHYTYYYTALVFSDHLAVIPYFDINGLSMQSRADHVKQRIIEVMGL